MPGNIPIVIVGAKVPIRFATARSTLCPSELFLLCSILMNPVTQEQMAELLCRILTGSCFRIENEYLIKEA